jgi:Zn finger protein HypA/HybF involved in hydrogenase expression
MHEFSLASEIVTVALEAASKAEAGDLTAVHVTMDPSSHLDPSVLADAFEMAASGTRAADATLEVVVGDSGGGEVAVTAIDANHADG